VYLGPSSVPSFAFLVNLPETWYGKWISFKKHYVIHRYLLNAVCSEYRVFRAQADWAFILPSELPPKELRHLPAASRTEKSDKPAQ
jgi:hypothetical protein